MSILKHCPFCGSEPKRTYCIGCGYVQIVCPECGANISITIHDKNNYSSEEKELIKRWNSRTAIPNNRRYIQEVKI